MITLFNVIAALGPPILAIQSLVLEERTLTYESELASDQLLFGTHLPVCVTVRQVYTHLITAVPA